MYNLKYSIQQHGRIIIEGEDEWGSWIILGQQLEALQMWTPLPGSDLMNREEIDGVDNNSLKKILYNTLTSRNAVHIEHGDKKKVAHCCAVKQPN